MPLPPLSFSAPSSARSGAELAMGDFRFGDNNVGTGAGGLSPGLIIAVAVVAVLGLVLWLRRK